MGRPTRPLADSLKDPERMYRHLCLGLMLVSGSSLSWMSQQIESLGSCLKKEDGRLLRGNWTLVKARLIADGYV